MSRALPHTPDADVCTATIDFDAAQAILARHAAPLGVERVPLGQAGRRVLAEPVIARIASPRADTAAMDGYAIRDADLATGRRRFRVAGARFAGARSSGVLPSGEALRIMTGAEMPAGADRIVMLEHVTRDGEHIIVPDPGERRHVRAAASDFDRGDVLLPVGRMIDPRALAVAASADRDSVMVCRRPRIACIASGDELAAPGAAGARDRAIPDCLSDAVMLMARQWGGKPGEAMRVGDDPDAIVAAMADMIGQSDLVVMIGGASHGDRDFARAALDPLGLAVAFGGVAIRPGKPVWYGRIGPRHVLGLPGNPTAAMTTARLFLAPLLTALGGQGARAGLTAEALPLAAEARLDARVQFLCGQREDGAVRIIARQDASSQAMLAGADLLVRLPPGIAVLPAGSPVAVYRF